MFIHKNGHYVLTLLFLFSQMKEVGPVSGNGAALPSGALPLARTQIKGPGTVPVYYLK